MLVGRTEGRNMGRKERREGGCIHTGPCRIRGYTIFSQVANLLNIVQSQQEWFWWSLLELSDYNIDHTISVRKGKVLSPKIILWGVLKLQICRQPILVRDYCPSALRSAQNKSIWMNRHPPSALHPGVHLRLTSASGESEGVNLELGWS